MSRSLVLYREDLAGVVHRVVDFQRGPYGKHDCWTPRCQPNEDWLILRDSASNGPLTCLWCVAEKRFK